MEPGDLAIERFQQGYNCSQAVFSALAERHGMDPEVSLRASAAFGGGMARTAQTCGCVTGALMAIGLAQSSVTPEENQAAREKTYAAAQRFLAEFASRHGSTQCLELLGCDLRIEEGRQRARDEQRFKTICAPLVREAVELAEAVQA